ncbi:MAG: hypothetical protein ACI959_001868 [Limisphaerales bacterium]|jgi:hypothetical protein
MSHSIKVLTILICLGIQSINATQVNSNRSIVVEGVDDDSTKTSTKASSPISLVNDKIDDKLEFNVASEVIISSIEIYNFGGKLVHQENEPEVKEGLVSVATPQLKKGSYIARIKRSGSFIVVRFVKG